MALDEPICCSRVLQENMLGMPHRVSSKRARGTCDADLECRRKLRQAGWDAAAVEEIKAAMKRLEQQLRELDE